MANDNIEELCFEEALKKLISIVEMLESDEVSLEDSISLYEKGMILSKKCSTTLENANLRIEQVNKNHIQ